MVAGPRGVGRWRTCLMDMGFSGGDENVLEVEAVLA